MVLGFTAQQRVTPCTAIIKPKTKKGATRRLRPFPEVISIC